MSCGRASEVPVYNFVVRTVLQDRLPVSRSADPKLEIVSRVKAALRRFPDTELEVVVGVVGHGPATVADLLEKGLANAHPLESRL
jgi:hypothetical protein